MVIDRKRLVEAAGRQRKAVDTGIVPLLTEKAEEMEEVKAQVDDLEEQLKKKKEKYRHLAEHEVPELMEKAGIVSNDGKGTFSLRSGARIHLKMDLHVGVRKEDKPGLFTWLRKAGLMDVIKEDVNAQTLKALCKERIEDGCDLPPMVTSHFATSAVLTRPSLKERKKNG